MRHILYSVFLEDCINQLDEKYQKLFTEHKDKYFLYANIIEIPAYYKLFTYQNNPDYSLYNKLHNEKHKEVINLIKSEIFENNYNTDILLLLYGYIAHIILDYYLESYIANILQINSMKNNMKNYSKISSGIEASFYQEKYDKSINNFKLNSESLYLTQEVNNTINKILSEIFFSSIGIKIYQISFDKFLKYQKKWTKDPLGLKKLYLATLDLFTKRKKYSAASISKFNTINKHIDYLNKDANTWYINGNIKTEKTFNELYEKAISVCITVLNNLNEEIFYKKKQKHIKINTTNIIE